MPLFAWIVALSLTIGASLAHAQPAQITIVQPAEATTMDPGRSTQVLTVNYFYNLYDTLPRWDTALQLQPGLATVWRSGQRHHLGVHAAPGREVPRRRSAHRGGRARPRSSATSSRARRW